MASATALWESVLNEVRLVMTYENYATWLESTRAISYDGVHLQVAAVTAFQREWLDRKLRRRIEQALRRLGHDKVDMVFIEGSDDRPS